MKDASMKQNAMRSIQPKVLRSVVITIMTFALIALVPIAVMSQSSAGDAVKQQSSNSSVEKELISLSKEKWRWMSERKVDSLNALFHEKAVFVHMGATMTKTQELEVIKSGTIQYKTIYGSHWSCRNYVTQGCERVGPSICPTGRPSQ